MGSNSQKTYLLIVTLALLPLPESVFAQYVGLRVLTEDNVLPTNNISSVYQTRDGFIWIGTEDEGLLRFDGQNVVQFTTENGLGSNSITTIFEDNENNIWLGDASGGLALFQNGAILFPVEQLELYTSIVNDIYQDGNGSLWISTLGDGLFKKEGDEIKKLGISDGLRSDTVWGVRQFDDDLWILSNNGLAYYNLERGVITWQNQKDNRDYYDAAEIGDNSVWLASNNGIVISGDSTTIIEEIEGHRLGQISSISARFGGGAIFVSEEEGIYIYTGELFIKAAATRSDPGTEPKSFYKDLSGKRWITTKEKGINFLTNHATFRYGLEDAGILNINSLHRDENGFIWIGGREGLALVKPLGVVGYLSTELKLDIPVYDIIEHQGALYLLSENNRIYRYSDDFGLMLLSSLIDQIPSDITITDLFFDSKSHLWIGTDDGIGVHDSKQITWTKLSDNSRGNYILHIAEQDNGNLIIGTAENIHVLRNGIEDTPVVLSNALSGVQVRYILSKGSDYWIGTSKGLYAFNTTTSELYHFNDTHGIISQNIQGITSPNDSTVFVATSAGLHKLTVTDSYEISSTHFRLNNDYSGAKVHHRAIFSADGIVWVGTDTGVYSYDLSAEPGYKGPEIYFNSISVDYVRNGALRFREKLQEYPQQKSIISGSSLKHQENNLTFNFTGIDFANPERLQYSHRLLGSTDERWTPFSSESSINVESLDPGTYTFQVKAKNDLGLVSSSPLSFTFLIDPPFYRTYWFFTLATVFVIGLLYTLERVRLQWLESNKLRDLVEQRTLSLRENLKEREILIQEVHHRTKNNLAVISGLLELQKSKIQDENVRHSLVQAQVRVQSIALIHEKLYKNDSLSKINFRNYIEDLLSVISRSYNVDNKPIKVHLNIDEIDITLDQGIPCGLILNELVSNAYEHAFKGRDEGDITISFKNKGKNVVFEVMDSGNGFPEDYELSKSSSLGMTLVHTLTKQINGNLEYLNSNGSKFVITFKREHY